MIKVLVEFLKGDTPYRAGDITWVKKEEYERLKREEKVKEYKEEMFFPLEGRTIVTEGKKVSMKDQKIRIPKVEKKDKLICPICGEKFKTIKELKNHKWKKHKIK